MKKNNILDKEVEKIEKDIINWRRYFHMYPELGFEEYKTSEKIQEILKEGGIKYEIKAKTGVVGYINKDFSKTIGIRADIDALPIEEQTELEFCSKNKGIMHACGHDGHIATLLGVGLILNKFKDSLNYNLKLIFQPCEEKLPGGALELIKEKVLDNVNFLIGFHFISDIPLNKIYIEKGIIMANTDRFKIIIEGKGGHGSTPDLTNDPIVCASYIISGLQTIISRRISPHQPAVISVCKIKGGDAFNVIPDKVEIEGTVRTISENTRKKIKNEMKKISEKIASSFHCKIKFYYDFYSPSVKNDFKFTEVIEKTSKEILPSKNFYKYHPSMGGEDFAFYGKLVPSTYIFIGCGRKSGFHHSSKFNLDERVLPFAVKYLSNLILNLKI